jgi:hypothetical protein
VRNARRRGLSETHAEAVCGLLRVALLDEDPASTERYARATLRYYRADHPERWSVLLDIAEARLRLGAPIRAAALLHEALQRPELDLAGQVRALSMLVRAEGVLGDRVALADAWHRATELIVAQGSTSDGARLLLLLARSVRKCVQTCRRTPPGHALSGGRRVQAIPR